MKRFVLTSLAIFLTAGVWGSAVAQTEDEVTAPLPQDRLGVLETHDGAVFGVSVDQIIYWLNPARNVTAPAPGLRHWDNSVIAGTGTDAESTVILRLVLNTDVRLVGTATPLTHPTNPDSTLATFVNVETDGDGRVESLIDGTGDPATGFPQAEYSTTTGVGPGNFVYVGGGSETAGAGSNVWATPERMGELSAQSGGVRYGLGELLNNGPIIRHVPRDGAVLISVRVQARNGEDFGPDSDDTEAPDLAVDAPYIATVQLTAIP